MKRETYTGPDSIVRWMQSVSKSRAGGDGNTYTEVTDVDLNTSSNAIMIVS
jgi:hypothetical protein